MAAKDTRGSRRYLSDVIKKYRAGKYSLDEVGIPGGIGKSLDDYDNDDAQVRGAKYANENLHTEFGKGSKPKESLHQDRDRQNIPRRTCSVLSTPTRSRRNLSWTGN